MYEQEDSWNKLTKLYYKQAALEQQRSAFDLAIKSIQKSSDPKGGYTVDINDLEHSDGKYAKRFSCSNRRR